jgi:hypothetical protein
MTRTELIERLEHIWHFPIPADDKAAREYSETCKEAAAALSALPAAQVKGLEWRYYPDAFPPMYVSQNAAFGNYSIEEAAGSDSPTYDVLNPTMGLMVNCDGLPEAKAAAQADYEKRILSALAPAMPDPTPTERSAGAELAKKVWGIDLVPSDPTEEASRFAARASFDGAGERYETPTPRDLRGELERITRERDEFKASNDLKGKAFAKASAERRALEAENAALKAALEPFAEAAASFEKEYTDIKPDTSCGIRFDALCRARAAIEAYEAGRTGWRLVPVEPTETMLWKGWQNHHPLHALAGLRNSYQAMLAAAPSPEQETQ